MTTKTRPTETIQEAAERLVLAAVETPELLPCYSSVMKIIATFESVGYNRKRTPMTQVEKLLDHMRNIGPISQREAYLEYDIQSFHRRLSDIRAMGINLTQYPKVNPVTGQTYTRYGITY